MGLPRHKKILMEKIPSQLKDKQDDRQRRQRGEKKNKVERIRPELSKLLGLDIAHEAIS